MRVGEVLVEGEKPANPSKPTLRRNPLYFLSVFSSPPFTPVHFPARRTSPSSKSAVAVRMLVERFKDDFYSVLYGERVLILANFDVDAVCTSKIITELFRADAIAYSFVPVDGFTAMRNAFNEYSHTAQIVVLINCGVCFDILAVFGHPTDKKFYVIDSHRPIHISNIYDETRQVRVMSMDKNEDIPHFDDIFRDYDSDEDIGDDDEEEEDESMEASSDEDSNSPRRARPKKRKRNQMTHETRTERIDWEDRRHSILHHYSQFRYHSLPSALVALELAWSLGRHDIHFVWWSIVALTDALVMGRITRPEYIMRAAELHSHIARITSSQQNIPRECLQVTFQKEPFFLLYRHWNLYESIKMTPHTASMLRTFSLKGECRFHEMLGELGLPLAQCKQKYSFMESKFKKKLIDAFASSVVRDKYNVEDTAIATFIASIGFRPKFSAFDSQHACFALLENPDVSLTPTDRYMQAFDSLSSKINQPLMNKGIEISKMFVTATFLQVKALINARSMRTRGAYLLAEVPEGAPDLKFFSNTSGLISLARFTQIAAVNSGRSRSWGVLPLVLTCPVSKEWTSIIGIKPCNFENPRSLFGKLFESIADKMESGNLILDSMEPHIAQVKVEHKEEFLSLLEACLA